MAEGRTDPQRRWTIYVCPQCGGIGGGVEGGVICSCAGAVEQVVVVPADDQLTAEDAQRILEAWKPVYGEPVVLKLRRIAGREDS